MGHHQQKSLYKSEKDSIKMATSTLQPEVTTTIALANVRKQLRASNLDLEAFVIQSLQLLLTDHLQQVRMCHIV